MVRVISFIGANDSDILPFFVDHYRRIGVSEFHLFLHGTWSSPELAAARARDITLAGIVDQPYSELLRSPVIEEYARGFLGEWLIIADADELLELPYSSLKRTIAALCCLGAEELPATLLQRVSADGRLPTLSEEASLDATFPCFDFRLVERMNFPAPIWKQRYPLVRINEHVRLSHGNHLPHSGAAAAHLPIRGVVHHFKWRSRLLRSIQEKRGAEPNQEEMEAYRRWLEENDSRVPSDGLQRYSRGHLFDAGYLVKPDRAQLRRISAVRKAAERRNGDSRHRVSSSTLQSIPIATNQSAGCAVQYLDRTGLLGEPGRIAIVTSHICGPTRTSGIATAISALAERLAAAGHDVHVIFCPFRSESTPEDKWIEFWAARGVVLHYFPRGTKDRWPPQDEFVTALALILDGEEWDVIHFHEAGGYAAAPLLLRAAGLRFTKSKIVVTVHGPARWHRVGDYLPWSLDEALQSQFEALSLELADLIIYPSQYMENWCRRFYPSTAPHLLLPNAMTGETRRFKAVERSRRVIKKVVFFGRIELRKGVDVFLDAIEGVLRAGRSDFEAVFLGRFGESVSKEQLEQRISSWECRTKVINNYSNADAIDLLRNEECLAVIPSRVDNAPFTIYECLENGIPILTSGVGGIEEMIRGDDREIAIVRGGAAAYTARILDALTNGISPASLSFDPGLVDIDILAVHARLVSDARASHAARPVAPTSKATVIVYGSGTPPEPKPLQTILQRWIKEGVEVLADWKTFPLKLEEAGTAPPSSDREEEREGEACNRLAAIASEDFLLFCRSNVAPFPESITAMLTLIESTRADAAVCGYRTFGADEIPTDVPVFGGAPELSTSRNGYGAGFFMVRKQSFHALGGFATDRDVAEIMEREFLNRLEASGRRVVSIPIAMALVPRPIPAPDLSSQTIGRLAAPWVEAAPAHLQGFVRMALHAAKSRPAANAGKAIPQKKQQSKEASAPSAEAPPASSQSSLLGAVSSAARNRLSAAYRMLVGSRVRKGIERNLTAADIPHPMVTDARSVDRIQERAPIRQDAPRPEPSKDPSAGVPSVARSGQKITAPLGEHAAKKETPRGHAEPILWEADSPLNDILESAPNSSDGGGKHVGAGGTLLNGASTYWVHSALDAAGCDFLVFENLVKPGQSEELCHALSELWERPTLHLTGPQPGTRSISLAEVLADRPKAGRVLHDTLQRSLKLTGQFYRLRPMLRPASARIVRRDAGAFTLPELGEHDQPDIMRLSFQGVVYLNDRYQAGETLFTALNIGVRPSLGMLVAATRSSYHQSAVQKVTSGSQLTMEFTMACRAL